jgi:type IV pilus assembly protein PilZ
VLEKRQHPRQAVDLQGTVTVEGSALAIVGRVRDLSIGGMFFVGEGKLAFGTKVKVTIEFPKPSGTLEFPGVVRWGGEDGFGVQFGLVGARETHAITQVIRKR